MPARARRCQPEYSRHRREGGGGRALLDLPKTPDAPIGAALVRMVVVSTAGAPLPHTRLVVI